MIQELPKTRQVTVGQFLDNYCPLLKSFSGVYNETYKQYLLNRIPMPNVFVSENVRGGELTLLKGHDLIKTIQEMDLTDLNKHEQRMILNQVINIVTICEEYGNVNLDYTIL